jgi:hypothetical protein
MQAKRATVRGRIYEVRPGKGDNEKKNVLAFSSRGKSLEQQLNREFEVFGSPQKARTPEIVSRIGI